MPEFWGRKWWCFFQKTFRISSTMLSRLQLEHILLAQYQIHWGANALLKGISTKHGKMPLIQWALENPCWISSDIHLTFIWQFLAETVVLYPQIHINMNQLLRINRVRKPFMLDCSQHPLPSLHVSSTWATNRPLLYPILLVNKDPYNGFIIPITRGTTTLYINKQPSFFHCSQVSTSSLDGLAPHPPSAEVKMMTAPKWRNKIRKFQPRVICAHAPVQ